VALGTAASGALARHYSERHETAYFGILGLIALAVGAGLWAAGPLLRRLMGAGYTDRS
jgi:proton-dependent oligopeptide transporter, POT family